MGNILLKQRDLVFGRMGGRLPWEESLELSFEG